MRRLMATDTAAISALRIPFSPISFRERPEPVFEGRFAAKNGNNKDTNVDNLHAHWRRRFIGVAILGQLQLFAKWLVLDLGGSFCPRTLKKIKIQIWTGYRARLNSRARIGRGNQNSGVRVTGNPALLPSGRESSIASLLSEFTTCFSDPTRSRFRQ